MSDVFTQLWHRFEHVIHELGKFGVVGLIAFVIDASIYNALQGHMHPTAAKALATVVAASVAFVGNRFWTWRHRVRSGLHREYGLYFFFNGVGLLIAVTCVWISHDLLGSIWPDTFHTRLANNVSGLGVGMALGTMFRFWAYRRFVFRAPDMVTQATPAPALVPSSD